MRDDVPEPEDFGPKEVYAFFGLTYYSIQVLEQGLVNLAVALSAQKTSAISTKDILSLYENEGAKTFGRILHEARSIITLPKDIDNKLTKALQFRNYLAHRFFVENAEPFISDSGKAQMIEELRGILAFINDVNAQFDPIWIGAWKTLGFSKEWFDQQFKRINEDE